MERCDFCLITPRHSNAKKIRTYFFDTIRHSNSGLLIHKQIDICDSCAELLTIKIQNNFQTLLKDKHNRSKK